MKPMSGFYIHRCFWTSNSYHQILQTPHLQYSFSVCYECDAFCLVESSQDKDQTQMSYYIMVPATMLVKYFLNIVW